MATIPLPKLFRRLFSLFLIYAYVMMLGSSLIPEAYSQHVSDAPIQSERDLLLAISKLPDDRGSEIRGTLTLNQHLISPRLLELASQMTLASAYLNSEKSSRFLDTVVEITKFLNNDHLKEEVINLLGDLASVYLYKSEYEKARQYALQSFNFYGVTLAGDLSTAGRGGDYGIASSLTVLGSLDAKNGNFSQAVSSYQKAYALFQRWSNSSLRSGYKFLEYDNKLIDTLSGLGQAYNQLGENIQALTLFDKALSIAQAASRKSRIAGTLNDIGCLFLRQEDYGRAIDYFSQSLDIYLNLNLSQDISKLEYNLGLTYQRMGDSDRALDFLKRSQKRAREGHFLDMMIRTGEGLSTVFREQRNYTKALEELDQSESLARSVNDTQRLAEILWLRAKIYQAARKYGEAIREANAAIIKARDVNARNVLSWTHTTLGECYLAQKMFEPAHQHLSQAIRDLEDLRKRIAGREYEKQLFFERKISPYNSMVDLLVQQNKPMEALLFAEKTKARTLIDVLNQGKIDPFQGMSLEERLEEKRLNQQIIKLNRLLKNESLSPRAETAKINKLDADLASARSLYSSFQTRLVASNKDQSSSQPPATEISEIDLNNMVRDHRTAILEYVVTDNGIYLFVITKPSQTKQIKISLYDIAISRQRLEEKAAEFHRMIAAQDLLFSPKARELYDLLIKPAEKDLQDKATICLIPDGVLWNIPFQATRNVTNRYLLEDYSIYYAPSLTTLKMLFSRTRSNWISKSNSLLSLANPSIKKSDASRLAVAQRGGDFEPLPEAETEVKQIERLFPARRSKSFIGEAATESSFKSLASQYDILHLATHGVLDNRHPLYSYLLCSDDGLEQEDGLLEAREVMNLDLHSDLVVLSACETARGSIKRGEGVVGMSWAFLVAGTRATIVSQWKVNSAGTARLMVGFYQHLLNSNADSISQAFRKAALDLSKGHLYGHPYYWASFIIIGDGE